MTIIERLDLDLAALERAALEYGLRLTPREELEARERRRDERRRRERRG